MVQPNYDESSVDSILKFAKRLTGRSLAQVLDSSTIAANTRNRGDLGNMVQELYFGLPRDNKREPDFAMAGLELKTTGVERKSNGEYRAKERLVLTNIDYESIVDEDWEGSQLLSKCRLILLLWYLYEQQVSVIDRRFVIDPVVLNIFNQDLPIIRRDWEFIRQKVVEGKAHELSEGDTYYLGACRKGSGGPDEKLRRQPHSATGAKSRAFSFKQKYVSEILAGLTLGAPGLLTSTHQTFEEATSMRFAPFIGKTVDQISDELEFSKRSRQSKSANFSLAKMILTRGGGGINELVKADIELKTIGLKKGWKPKESMSFPGFKYMEIINEEWEDSSFFEKTERKFLFVIYRSDEKGVKRLEKVAYWNMPYADRLEAKRVWEETKKRVAVDASDLPKIGESHVAHVRTKAQNGEDKEITPQGDLQVKKCFWLNRSYIASIVASI